MRHLKNVTHSQKLENCEKKSLGLKSKKICHTPQKEITKKLKSCDLKKQDLKKFTIKVKQYNFLKCLISLASLAQMYGKLD